MSYGTFSRTVEKKNITPYLLVYCTSFIHHIYEYSKWKYELEVPANAPPLHLPHRPLHAPNPAEKKKRALFTAVEKKGKSNHPNKVQSITSWWFQLIWKICSSNWIISPSRGENSWKHQPDHQCQSVDHPKMSALKKKTWSNLQKQNQNHDVLLTQNLWHQETFLTLLNAPPGWRKGSTQVVWHH